MMITNGNALLEIFGIFILFLLREHCRVISCGVSIVPCKPPCFIILTTTEIVALDFDNNSSSQIISGLSKVIALDVHYSLGYIFWTDVSDFNIKRSCIDGTNVTVIHTTTGTCDGLAVEWMRYQLYWTDTTDDVIRVSDLEGKNTRILISLGLDEPRGIALDPERGSMFWTDWGAAPKIETATLNGTERTTLVNTNLQWPNGVTLDRKRRLVFWVDAGKDRLESINYEGNKRTLLFARNNVHFFGVTFNSPYIFVSEWDHKSVFKMNIFNGTIAGTYHFGGRNKIMGIVPYDRSWQRQAITCPGLPSPRNGTRLGCSGNATEFYDTVCQFGCNNGYVGSGSHIRRCQENETWSGEEFICQRICEYLQLPPNVRTNGSCNRLPGIACYFTCERGFNLIGSAIRWCDKDGFWTGTQPRCDVVTCPMLSLPTSGIFVGCNTNTTEMLYGTECSFSCKEGSVATGSMGRRCTENGNWTGTDLECTVPVTNETGAVNVTEGESVSLNCTISGDGSYTWERRDKIEIENPRRQVKGGGRLLEIIDTAIADSGVYICRVGRNSHTITLQVLVQVKVEMALKVENYNYTKELENKSSPQYKEIEQNFTAEMNFVYRNTPGYIRTDVLKMTKGSVVVDFNIIIQIITTDPKNETTINDKKVSIVQTTIKEAEDGFVKRLKVSKVIPKTEPPEPNGVEIFDIKSDELSVRWKPSEDAETFDVRTYSVQYRAYGEKTYSEHNQTANTENADYSYRIKSLESETVYMIRVGAVNTYGSNFNEETGHETEPAPFAWWIIVLAVLGVLLILGILIGIIIYRRRRARDRREQTEARFQALENQTGSHKGEVAAYHGENVKGLSYSFKNTAYKPGEMNWEEFPHENIKLLDELGSGAFGIVFKGELQQENGNIIPCAVKTLKPSATKVERKDLYNELDIMANVGHHPNLVNLIGACTQDDLLLVIIELAENGCLLDFLKQSRQQDGNNTTSGLTEHMKTSIAVDVARGMAHLARCRCIHRDLAARNVLLGKDYVAKVSDYGMARDVYEQLMYKKETQGKLPVKWMAVESLETYTFTMESDVWAYGVLLWEIESGGLKPYAGLSTAELIENLKNGYRMEKPNGCSDEMYQTMRDCWNSSPSARPNFDELVVRLESTITT